MFRGDILNFSPADLLIFLAHLGKEGVLTVRAGLETLSFCFQRGSLVDAQAEEVDRLLLRMLRRRADVPEQTLAYIERAKQETGLPLRQILENLEWLGVPGLEEVLAAGVRDTVFRLFLLERGEFHFAELPVEAGSGMPPLDCQQLVMDTVRRLDEYRETLRGLAPLTRAPRLTAAGRQAGGSPRTGPAWRPLLEMLDGRRSLRELLHRGPFPLGEAAAALAAALAQGWIELVATAEPDGPPAGSGDDGFPAYRRALRQMLRAPEPQAKLQVLLAFSRERFDCTLLVAVRRGQVFGGRLWRRDPTGALKAGERLPAGARLEIDPIFQRVATSRLAFCGGVFESRLLAALGFEPPAGSCALVPIGELEGSELLVYAAAAGTGGSLPHLELLSWHLQTPAPEAPSTEDALAPLAAAAPPAVRPRPAAASPGAPGPRGPGTAPPGGAAGEAAGATGTAGTPAAGPAPERLQRLISTVGELPPMPRVTTRALEMLADPDCRLANLATTLSTDPALVARLVKVANSALYSGGRKVGSLNEALVRLGLRTTRGLVIAVSARSLFPMDGAGTGPWSRELWQHSVQCGLAARRVAQAVGGCDPDEAFVAGVLHDIGKVLILLSQPEAYRRALRLQQTEGIESCAAEIHLLGFDHAQAGARLLEHWGMPAALVAGVGRHHEPDGGPLARLVACADELSHAAEVAVCAGGDGAEQVASGPRAEALGLPAARLANLRDAIAADILGCDLMD